MNALAPAKVREGAAEAVLCVPRAVPESRLLGARAGAVQPSRAGEDGRGGSGVKADAEAVTRAGAQDAAWRASVLPKGLPRVAVEAGVTAFWHKYVGLDGAVVGIDTYGESAPAGALFKHFGLTAEKVAEAVKRVL